MSSLRTDLSGRVVLAGAAAVAVLLIVATAPGDGSLDVPSAALLGLVEGLTEFVPVSSTGHLTVVERLLDIRGAAADAYVIVIQAGAILAVLVLYRHRMATMVAGLRGRDREGLHLLRALALAFVPAAVLGLALGDTIKERLFGVGPVALAWAVGGLVILVVARRGWSGDGGLESLTSGAALAIGFAQAAALWPGVSRSLVTILAGLLLGLHIRAAVEFSFLLGFATLGAATGYEALAQGGEIVRAYGVAAPVVGFVVAFVSAVVAVRWMVGYLERRTLSVFGYYRLAVAAGAFLLLATHRV